MTRLKQPGFTIVELLIVIVVIGILAAITIVAYNGIQGRARDAQRVSEMNRLKTSLDIYFTLNGQYPTCGSTLCTTTGGWGDIATLPVTPPVRNDPSNSATQWGYYYAQGFKKTGSSTYVGTGKVTDYMIATRLEAGGGSVYTAWDNSNLNFLDGN